ncbi:uncharacterized protein BDW43DRAFT_313295 [Aspergillus alliaceus]|uniref:uncharacterized protein n=1 Tax=Petromyces alliaceus TaxID=209559 RepID=UPI0012A4383B|nr:uncharacterized protein BDW43DRAFT_313295 [Aspergillus alliaceus]KAB8231217.1 hypothetical protein BDW43DRAFT_313295 [Aspergillus alliaceus]
MTFPPSNTSPVHQVSLSISIPASDEKVSCPTTPFPRYIPTLALSNFRTLRLYSLGRGSATLSVDTTKNVAPDYLSQTRLALQLQRLLDNDMAHASRKGPVKLDLGVRDVLNWPTHNGSDAVGMTDRIGTLAPGKRADLIFISSKRFLRLTGVIRKRDGQLVGYDLDSIRAEANVGLRQGMANLPNFQP